MTKSQHNEADVKFICERVLWSLQLTPEALMRHCREHRMDAFHYLPDPQRNMIIIGREATDRFKDIAKRFLASQPVKKRQTDLAEFIKQLKEEFSRRFVRAGQEPTRQNIDRMIAAAHKQAAQAFVPLRHYIPCAIFLSRSVKGFAVGPVQFLHATEFFAQHRAGLEQRRQEIKTEHQARTQAAIAKGFSAEHAATPEDSAKLAGRLVDGVLDFYGQYQWCAEVAVPVCNEKISYERALFLARTALDIIKLMLGRQYTHRLRTAEDRGHAQQSAKLSRGPDDKFRITLTSTPNDNVLGDDWLKVLHGGDGFYFRHASRALELAAGFSGAPPLCLRFIDALSWYGEAIAEKSPAARIVKLVTALEAMTGTGPERDAAGKETRGVTDLVTTRAAIWHQFATGGTFGTSRKEIARIYDCRSNLVHGSVSPFDEAIFPLSHEAEEIVRTVLLTGLDYFTSLGLDNPAMTPAGLRRQFAKLEQDNAGK